jgi:hypothetical protein
VQTFETFDVDARSSWSGNWINDSH